MVDYGVVFGVSGLLAALVSILYSHAQVGAARRQAEAEWRLARLEIGNAFFDRVRHARTRIVATPVVARQYVEANPQIGEVASALGGLEGLAVLRDFLDATQEVFFLRRAGFIEDYDWRVWVTSAIPISRMPALQLVFANASERGALEPDFVAFFRPLVSGGVPDDPLRRVVLPQPPRAAAPPA